MRTRLLNLYGAPGSGKSLMMLRLAAVAKLGGAFCEICPEVAKEYVVRHIPLSGGLQIEVTREQHRRLLPFLGHVDYLITDAPLLIGGFYAEDRGQAEAPQIVGWAEARHAAIREVADVVNVYVARRHAFVQDGRYQDEAGAVRIARDMLAFVRRHHGPRTLVEVESTADPALLWDRLRTCPPEDGAA